MLAHGVGAFWSPVTLHEYHCQGEPGSARRSGRQRHRHFPDPDRRLVASRLLLLMPHFSAAQASDDPSSSPVCLGGVGSRWSDPATRSALREQIPIAVSELSDQYLMQRVTWASSSLTAKAASPNRGRLITARIPFDNASPCLETPATDCERDQNSSRPGRPTPNSRR